MFISDISSFKRYEKVFVELLTKKQLDKFIFGYIQKLLLKVKKNTFTNILLSVSFWVFFLRVKFFK